MMNKGLTIFCAFAAGAIAGSLASVAAVKKHYNDYYWKLSEEETASMKEYYEKKIAEIENVTNMQVETRAYEIIADRYSSHSQEQKILDRKKDYEEDECIMEERPYVIEPEELGDTDYEVVSLNYYADHVLTFENDDVIENVDELVGRESLSHFGEYEDDAVYVRNDMMKTDFEILADTRNYSDIYATE